MGTEMMKKTRFFPIWEEEKEYRWLEGMSKRGWHLKSKGYLSYFFERGDTCEYVYRYDFKLAADRDYEDYIGLFSESGWELVDIFANWHYFRHEKGSGGEDIYTDTESKRQRLKRLFALMAALAVINLVIMSNSIFLLSITEDGLKGTPIFMFFIWGLMAAVISLLAYAAARIFIRLRKLKKSVTE